MKELLPEANPEKVELHAQKEIEKERKMVGQIIPFKGHTLYEINCSTGNIAEAEYDVEAINYQSAVSDNMQKKRKVITKENCVYISCLNKKSARKKFLKFLMNNSKNMEFK